MPGPGVQTTFLGTTINERTQPMDIENPVKLAAAAGGPQHDMGECRRKRPLSSKDKGLQPDRMPIVLVGGQERKVRTEWGMRPMRARGRYLGGMPRRPLPPISAW